MQWRLFRSCIFAVTCAGMLALSGGCQWFEQLKGPGFPGWDDNTNPGFRGKDPQAKPSGFLFDRRSEQIEKNLGGSY